MRTLLALAAVVAGATPLAGQSLKDLCDRLTQITVGQWAEYEMTGQQGTMQIRFAIVGTESVDGKDHYWQELKLNSQQGPVITQALVPGFPYDQQDVQAMVMKMGDQPAMKMPKSMMGMMQSMMQRAGPNPGATAREALKKCETAEVIGPETIEVPAGRLETVHFRITDAGQSGEGWVSADVPFGLVKMTWAAEGGGQMVLRGHGKDAKSSITETPREMPGMPGR
jgi:hypothetical protein